MTQVLIIVGVIIAFRIGEVLYFFRLVKRFDERISKLEVAIVAQVMEENPQLVASVLATFEKLQVTMLSERALKEARRLHGLEP